MEFRCASGNNKEICSIDHIQFYGSTGTRKLASDDDVRHPKKLPIVSSSGVSIPETPRHFNPKSGPKYHFSTSSEFICKEETAGQTCPDTSSAEFNCCLNSDDYTCGTYATCDGSGQLLNGKDEMGKSW